MRVILILMALLLTLGCATTRVSDDALAGEMQSMVEEAINKPKLEDYGIPTKLFESMISRMIVAGYEVKDQTYGKMKAHWTEEYKTLLMIARSPMGFIVTIAKDTSTGEFVIFLDRDEDGIPETVNINGKGHAKVTEYDLKAYSNIIIALLQVEVYYPPSDDAVDE